MNLAANIMQLPVANNESAEEFGKEIYGARLDPSDPEDCFNFLYTQFPNRWREVMANMDGAIYAAGQLYINAEVRRAS